MFRLNVLKVDHSNFEKYWWWKLIWRYFVCRIPPTGNVTRSVNFFRTQQTGLSLSYRGFRRGLHRRQSCSQPCWVCNRANDVTSAAVAYLAFSLVHHTTSTCHKTRLPRVNMRQINLLKGYIMADIYQTQYVRNMRFSGRRYRTQWYLITSYSRKRIHVTRILLNAR